MTGMDINTEKTFTNIKHSRVARGHVDMLANSVWKKKKRTIDVLVQVVCKQNHAALTGRHTETQTHRHTLKHTSPREIFNIPKLSKYG